MEIEQGDVPKTFFFFYFFFKKKSLIEFARKDLGRSGLQLPNSGFGEAVSLKKAFFLYAIKEHFVNYLSF
jgi:hypothetical protein